jgi:hypothetical protein
LALSVNSDDPAFFNTNLTLEYLRLHQTFGYSPAELARLSLGPCGNPSCRNPSDRLEESFRDQFDALGRELFGALIEAPAS